MPSGSAKQTPQPKASEVAAETKRKYLPLIKSQYADQWPTYSFLIPQPLAQLAFTDRPATLAHPTFCEHTIRNPVSLYATCHSVQMDLRRIIPPYTGCLLQNILSCITSSKTAEDNY